MTTASGIIRVLNPLTLQATDRRVQVRAYGLIIRRNDGAGPQSAQYGALVFEYRDTYGSLGDYPARRYLATGFGSDFVLVP